MAHMSLLLPIMKNKGWDSPGSPVVKIPTFSPGVWVQSAAVVLRSHMSQGQRNKIHNRSSSATNSVKTLFKKYKQIIFLILTLNNLSNELTKENLKCLFRKIFITTWKRNCICHRAESMEKGYPRDTY